MECEADGLSDSSKADRAVAVLSLGPLNGGKRNELGAFSAPGGGRQRGRTACKVKRQAEGGGCQADRVERWMCVARQRIERLRETWQMEMGGRWPEEEHQSQTAVRPREAPASLQLGLTESPVRPGLVPSAPPILRTASLHSGRSRGRSVHPTSVSRGATTKTSHRVQRIH